MSEDKNPDRIREAEIRGGDAPDFAAMKPPDPQPEPGPEPGRAPEKTADEG